MAEAVGIVAASLEFTRAVSAFAKLLSSLKHATADLSELLQELNELDVILQTLVKQDVLFSTYVPDSIVKQCRQNCQNAVTDLISVCQGLTDLTTQSRFRGLIATVAKRSALEKARSRIDRARGNLFVAQSLSWQAFQVQKQEQTHALLVQAMVHITSSPQKTISAPPEAHIQKPLEPQEVSVPQASAQPDRVRSTRRRLDQPRRILHFQTLMLGKRLELLTDRASGAWNYTIRVYNVRRSNEPIFACVGTDNISGLKHLLARGAASLTDVDEAGHTLVHYTMAYGAHVIAQFLLEHGVDTNTKNFFGRTWVQELRFPSSYGSKSSTKTAQTLLKASAVDDFIEPNAYDLGEHLSGIGSETTKAIISSISPPWMTYSQPERKAAAYQACFSKYSRNDPECFKAILGLQSISNDCLTFNDFRVLYPFSEPNPLSLVVGLAIRIGRCHVLSWIATQYQGWADLLHEAVALGGVQASFDLGCGSPMLSYLNLPQWYTILTNASHNSAQLTLILRQWVQELMSAGQDLDQYGYLEDRCLRSHRERHGWNWTDFYTYCNARVIGFTYGKMPEDWNIWVETSRDEYAGEFWSSILLPDSDKQPEIPGAWPPDVKVVNNRFPWRWRYSRRNRRRLLRYMGISRKDETRVCMAFNVESLGKLKRVVAEVAQRQRQRKQAALARFRAAGIEIPPWRSRIM